MLTNKLKVAKKEVVVATLYYRELGRTERCWNWLSAEDKLELVLILNDDVTSSCKNSCIVLKKPLFCCMY